MAPLAWMFAMSLCAVAPREVVLRDVTPGTEVFAWLDGVRGPLAYATFELAQGPLAISLPAGATVLELRAAGHAPRSFLVDGLARHLDARLEPLVVAAPDAGPRLRTLESGPGLALLHSGWRSLVVGAHAAAIHDLTAARQHVDDDGIALWLALAHERLGHKKEALESYEDFAARCPRAELRQWTRARIAGLKAEPTAENAGPSKSHGKVRAKGPHTARP